MPASSIKLVHPSPLVVGDANTGVPVSGTHTLPAVAASGAGGVACDIVV